LNISILPVALPFFPPSRPEFDFLIAQRVKT